jgi:hypothetical protein
MLSDLTKFMPAGPPAPVQRIRFNSSTLNYTYKPTANYICIQKHKQTNLKTKTPSLSNGNMWAGRLAWLGRWLYEPKVAGSSPARPTNQISLFNQTIGLKTQGTIIFQ